jgi:hypothetical protein
MERHSSEGPQAEVRTGFKGKRQWNAQKNGPIVSLLKSLSDITFIFRSCDLSESHFK